MLLEVLGQQGEVEQQAPNRYAVRRGEREDLVVLLTPDQWERVIRRHGPGDVTTSTREKLPPARKPFPPLRETRRRLAEARASGGDYGWIAYPPGPRD